jgi:hypothetical protein
VNGELSKGPNRVCLYFSSSEDKSRSSSRNVVFPSYLNFQTMNKDYKPNGSECYHCQNPLDSTSPIFYLTIAHLIFSICKFYIYICIYRNKLRGS